MNALLPWGMAALVSVCSLWFADHALQNNVRLTEVNTGLAKQADALAGALANQVVLRERLDKIDRQTRSINSTLDGQTAQLNQSLAELKRTDEKITAYLAAPIPGALGLRYARPETTDPIAWRASAVVQPGAVPAAGSAAAVAQ
ncbi:hypothetical protein EB795_31830 [Pseudomonas mandelii]|uniref:hypothetical protein n=1 Tax=Pseudomonas mandelii TaxID=75612 RepID=UPI0012B380FC|nr:hypothetical protein [Pseudomonas mandelii]MSU98456.1 hypothetical protein [Pseudomonas mandelii]